MEHPTATATEHPAATATVRTPTPSTPDRAVADESPSPRSSGRYGRFADLDTTVSMPAAGPEPVRDPTSYDRPPVTVGPLGIHPGLMPAAAEALPRLLVSVAVAFVPLAVTDTAKNRRFGSD